MITILGGADLAEQLTFTKPVEPGMVVSIDDAHTGALCVSREAYNRKVSGVISGANNLNAGMVLSDGFFPGGGPRTLKFAARGVNSAR